MEAWLDAPRGQVVLFGPTFGRQVWPRLWWTPHGSLQTLSPKIRLDSPLMCRALGTPVPPYGSYTSNQPTTAPSQRWSCPCPHTPLLNLGQREGLRKGLCRS